MSRTSPFGNFRRSFRKNLWVPIRVRPGGFEIEDVLYEELTGRVIKVRLLRKRFEEGTLECYSADGVRSREGVLCDECRHPECRPQLRVHLESGSTIFVFDLAHTAAMNLLTLEEDLRTKSRDLATTDLVLTVINRQWWGEVSFRIV